MGPTLETLAFQSHIRAKFLLKSLSKNTSKWYDNKQQQIFRLCVPSIYCQQLTPLDPVENLTDAFVCRLKHLRENLFLIAYAEGIVEVRDLTSGADPLYSFKAPMFVDETGEEI
jgi:hypothetical protein